MKRETYAEKMAKLFGLEEVFEEHKDQYAEQPKPKGLTDKERAVQEHEIENFRAAQGIYYFFLAPKLFAPKVCKHCGDSFLVSRKQVAFCSYTCIKLELEKMGVSWSRYGNIESMIGPIYDGNEPLWVKNLDVIRELLDSVSSTKI